MRTFLMFLMFVDQSFTHLTLVFCKVYVLELLKSFRFLFETRAYYISQSNLDD